ncbi:formate dehydrogenase accessory sulfurtransferase FdhD [Gordonia rhizosphera]|uniref:Sulfur carrier protein FdhD n=1 Tax=Gordonia rhizosphera NBRC 16068 TaxID=1108045 RepID=K6WGU7_9ACTN|nr:formate dehydrogenase accessory sulfurtransferase FdhD [Gordonia rhizosphera]GAB93006.1 protein FdhD homolog [Gordonia rhizosphera NBRC 16068]
MGRLSTRTRVTRIENTRTTRRPDAVVVEEPLEIRINGTPISVTMRTPGSDFELAQGFLMTEGLIGARDDIESIRYCNSFDDDGRNTYNVLDVTLAPGVRLPDVGIERNFYTTSSCGVCGKSSLDAVRQRTRFEPAGDDISVPIDTLVSLPSTLREAQRVFSTTGGLHAAGLFDAEGTPFAVREDIGRHNAVDKLIGWGMEVGRFPLRHTILLVSGRASFELTQKAAMAGIPVLAAVSAPSSLAIDLADATGMTLVGFLRGESMNVYTHPERIVTGSRRR